jgi:predicted phosphodiesterase
MEYEPEQQPPIMEPFCRAMSDETGDIESNMWDILTHKCEFLESMRAVLRKGRLKQQIHNLQHGPEERLKDFLLRQVEQNACKDVKTNEVLVFGHTHNPFVNKKEKVANNGSWVKDATVYYTYVQLTDGLNSLYLAEKR